MIRVSFQGERGAYSEAAARSFFNEQIETIPQTTFAEALESTSDGKTQYSVLPVENSLEGSVGESYEFIVYSPSKCNREIYHRIEHCLIGTSGGGSIDKIDTVYSHPQALGQCRKFIEKHGMKTIPAYDTAGSVKMIKELNKSNCACIASRDAAKFMACP